MIGQTVGHFRILSRLGSGGMGVVYRAHDEKLQREIAIKVMSGDSDRPDLDRQRIIDEARAASGLSHPHICTVYETGEFQGQAYIAMEYVDGHALSEMIPPGGLAAEAVIRYGIQVADALSHAHRRGIIHRDLKTSNVVVDSDSRAKVLDFGLARRIALKTGAAVTRSGDLVPDRKLVGTLAYMAPEMLLHQTADERSDIWGLGVMLYEMASGEPPFKGRNEFEITAGILRTPAEALPAHVPPMLRAIIQRCIAKDPTQRYQHAGEVRAALEAIQSDVIAPPSSGSGRTDVIARPPDTAPVHVSTGAPARAIAIGVAVLAVVAVAAVFWLTRDTRSLWERVANGGQLTLVVASDDPLVDPSVSLDGKMLAYVALDKQNTSDVFVRRAAGGSLVRITNDRAREGSPRFSPDGERLAFTRREERDDPPEIRIVPSLGGDAIATIPVAADPRWSPSGTELVFLRPTSSGGAQLVVSNANGSNAHVLLEADSTFPFLRDPAWAPDGQEIAIVRGSGGVAGEIWLIPIKGGTPRRAMSDPPEVASHSPAYTADGLGIIHSSNRGGATNIWFYPRRGGAPVRLTAGPGPDLAPTVAADGTIAFINSRWRNTLDLYSLQRGVPPRVLSSHSPYLWGPSFSRDGKTIAFSRSEVDGSWHIWSIPIEGGTPKRLTDTPSGEVYSRFTPDRTSVLFNTWGAPRRIGRVPVDGGVPQMLDFGSASDAFPDMSPDGKWIAFTRTDADAERIYVAPSGGGTAHLLTPSPGTVPRWSPDGRQIAFGANRNSTGGVFVMDANGKNERRLTPSGGWPVWWPDGRQIGFMVPGRAAGQELQVISRDGGQPRFLTDIVYNGSNHPFDVSPDGTRIITTNAVHVSDEIWLLEPRVKQ